MITTWNGKSYWITGLLIDMIAIICTLYVFASLWFVDCISKLEGLVPNVNADVAIFDVIDIVVKHQVGFTVTR